MGSPLSPVVADIILQDLEEENVLSTLDLLIYYRHVMIFCQFVPRRKKLNNILEKFKIK